MIESRAMDIEALYRHLFESGYDKLIGRSGDGFGLLDYYIERQGGLVVVCDKERGEIVQVWLETGDEAAACAYFLGQVSTRLLHLYATSDAAAVERRQAALRAAGVDFERNDIPNFAGPGDTRYRIFVAGRDLKTAQQALNI